MTIQLNSDKNLTIHEAFRTQLQDMLKDELDRYSEQITRVEAHLSDENGQKNAVNDKRCLLEARVQGLSPIAVSHMANNHEQAVQGAIEKLKASLESKLGRLQSH